jgi:hypothetical protein
MGGRGILGRRDRGTGFCAKIRKFFLEVVPEPKLDSTAANELDEMVVNLDDAALVETLAEATPATFDDATPGQVVEAPETPWAPEIVPAAVQDENASTIVVAVQAPESAGEVEALESAGGDETIVPAAGLRSEPFQQEIVTATAGNSGNEAAAAGGNAVLARAEAPVMMESLEPAVTASSSAKATPEAEARVAALAATAQPEASAPTEILIDRAQELPTTAINGMNSATFSERMLGWIKRTFSRFMSLIGARI